MTHTITITRYDASDPRLGRHVCHDSRSLGYEFLPRTTRPRKKSTFWDSGAGPLQQGSLGSCTGNSVAGWLNTHFADDLREHTHRAAYMTEKDAVAIYSLGTRMDNYPGSYPPQDTGCDGLSVAKAAAKMGYLDRYTHTFGFAAMQAAVETTPVICGTVWTQSMYTPNNGLVKVGRLVDSNIVGGHEYLCVGVDWAEDVMLFRNSWGDQDEWPGCKPGGYFAVGFADFQKLLAHQGDVTVLHGKGMP
jgi:hypothetical protein